jgi:hypothetical protein
MGALIPPLELECSEIVVGVVEKDMQECAEIYGWKLAQVTHTDHFADFAPPEEINVSPPGIL